MKKHLSYFNVPFIIHNTKLGFGRTVVLPVRIFYVTQIIHFVRRITCFEQPILNVNTV